MNPQIAYGEDVMARIAYAMEGAREGARLCGVRWCEALSRTWRGSCAPTPASQPAQIVEAVLVGNTAMHHLFLGLPVEQLGTLALCGGRQRGARRQGPRHRASTWRRAPTCTCCPISPALSAPTTSPCSWPPASAKQPADESGSAWISAPTPRSAWSHAGGLLSCSTASGPAFEGAHIRYGMRAAAGRHRADRRSRTDACRSTPSTTSRRSASAARASWTPWPSCIPPAC